MAHLILIVEDDRVVRELLQETLETEGYEVAVGEHGLEALALVEAHRPDLILLDLGLPVMDGIVFAQELERRGMRGRIPILVLTVGGLWREKAEQIAAEGYMEKPFQIVALLDEVRRLIENKPAAPSGISSSADPLVYH